VHKGDPAHTACSLFQKDFKQNSSLKAFKETKLPRHKSKGCVMEKYLIKMEEPEDRSSDSALTLEVTSTGVCNGNCPV